MKGVLIKIGWVKCLEELNDMDRLEVYDAIMIYTFRGEFKNFTSVVAKTVFQLILSELDDYIKKQKEISLKRGVAGAKGGAPKSNKNAVKRPNKELYLFEEELPEQKPKKKQKPTKNKYAPYVMLTESEYNKLTELYGQDGADWMITKLDNYKEARGMTYKSDYRAILNWVVKEYEKENHGKTSEVRRSDAVSSAPTARQQRDSDFAEHIARKLSSS